MGDRCGLGLRDVSASQPTRALAQPENPVRPTPGLSFFIYYLTSLSFPRRRGPGTESQSGILKSVGLLPTRSMVFCVTLLQLRRSCNPAAPSNLEQSPGCSRSVSSSRGVAAPRFPRKDFLTRAVANC